MYKGTPFCCLEQEGNTGSDSSTKDTSVQDVGVGSAGWKTGRSLVGVVGTVRSVVLGGLDSSDSSEGSDDGLELHFCSLSDVLSTTDNKFTSLLVNLPTFYS